MNDMVHFLVYNLAPKFVIAAAVTSLVYSIISLLRTIRSPKTTGSFSRTLIHPKSFFFELIALKEPDVKRLLSPPPDKLILHMKETRTEKGMYEATLVARHGKTQKQVVIDLNHRPDLAPLFEVLRERRWLARGEDTWPKSRFRKKHRSRRRNNKRQPPQLPNYLRKSGESLPETRPTQPTEI